MLDCVLLVNDAPVRAVAPREGEVWPRRPALEFLLARARRTPLPVGGWRRWLLEQHGMALTVDPAAGTARHPGGPSGSRDPSGLRGLAGVAANGLGLPSGEYWLATPVHLVAGLDTVRLHPNGLLQLAEIHGQQLAADFARVFAGSGWQLHATGARELLLSAPTELTADSDDPADWLGEDPRAGLPRGADARTLRTLATELEMWLHEHAVNREREAARQLRVSGLWLWGGGATDRRPANALGRLYGDDLVAQALWAGAATSAAALPSGWAELRTGLPAESGADFVAACHVLLGFDGLEDAWLAPLIADWRRGRVRSIQLVAGRWQFELSAAARWRIWSRRVPWWERINA